MSYTDAQVWGIIVALGIGTFLIRFSFLGLIGDRQLPDWVLRHLRYTTVAILPGLVAPLVIWPDPSSDALDPARILAAMASLSVAYATKGVVRAILIGAVIFYGVSAMM